MEVTLSNRGKKKVLLDGYEYVKKISKKDWTRWQCRHQRSFGCKGAITTDLAITRHWSSVEHTHANDASATETTKLRVQLKRKATDTSEPPSRLLAEALTETSEQVRANVGDLETIRRDLRRQRSKVRPPEPSTLRDLHVQDTWATTGGARPQPFLLYDNGQERQDRMLVFSTHEQLAALSSSRTWYMDGTFSVCPRIFRQLYVLRCKLGDSSLACVYALLSGKSLSTYEELFQVILDSCEEKGYHPDPAVIISDYEIAAMKAAKEVFGEHVTTRGCFFHLCQSTHRKVRELGLLGQYKADDCFRKLCGMLDGLAFLPPQLVPEGLSYIRGKATGDIEDLLDYFDSTYVNGPFRISSAAASATSAPLAVTLRRRQPEFKPELWNVHEATLRDEDRTNNACEGWNNGFRKLVGHAHPSIWRLIECLQQDQALVDTALIKERRGEPPVKRIRKTTKRLQNRLKTICEHFQLHEDIPRLLEAVGECIRF
ncbi:unnamed protein product [Ixodes persulcatus]